MMSKPAPAVEEEASAPPSFAAPTSQKTSAVEDLERRLAMLGGEDLKPAAVVAPTPPAPVVAPTTAAAAAAAPTAMKGGKNALLVSRRPCRMSACMSH